MTIRDVLVVLSASRLVLRSAAVSLVLKIVVHSNHGVDLIDIVGRSLHLLAFANEWDHLDINFVVT